MALTTQFIRLKFTGMEILTDDGGIRCIKDFPEVDPHGEPDQIEITTLCDEYHEFMDGIKSLPEALEFTANYDETVFGFINSISEYNPDEEYGDGDFAKKDGVLYQCNTDSTTGAWDGTKWDAVVVELLFCESKSDTDGKNGKFTISQADISMKVNGAGVGDVLEMVYVIKPKGDIVFSTVA